MNILKTRHFDPDTLPGEYSLVAMWCAPRRARLIGGLLAGAFAGTMMLLFGMIYCAATGNDIMAPMKISAIPFLGGDALAYGSVPGLVVGTIAFYTVMSLLGMAYGHLTGINSRKGLFGVGLTWGAFGWVFINNLFLPAFRPYLAAGIPRGVMFFAWMVYGLSLMSVMWFDRVGYTAKPVKK